MSPLSRLFPELENSLYMHLGYILSGSLSPEIAIVLSAAENALGYSVDGLIGDEIILALRQRGENDLCRELRSAITIYNAASIQENS